MSDTRKLFPGMDRRQVREIAYRARAQLALGEDPRYTWLCDRSSIEDGRPTRWRPALLGELGRLLEERGREVMLALAAKLCEEQPATPEALALIRAARLEACSNASLPLTAQVLELVQQYRREHPDLEPAALVSALEDALHYLYVEGDEA